MIHFFCPIQAFSVIEVTIQDSLASVIGVGAVKFFGVRRNFARILPNLPEKYFKISDLQKKAFHVNSGSMRSPKKCSSCHFGRHFCSDFLGVLECSQRFSPDFMGFSPNQNFWGCACTPSNPVSYTSGFSGLLHVPTHLTTVAGSGFHFPSRQVTFAVDRFEVLLLNQKPVIHE